MMGKRLLWWLVAALAVGVAYAAAYRSAQPTGTPEGQIRAALMDGLDALQHGRAGAAMRVVAPDYKDSTGANRDRLYLLAREAAQNREWWSANIQRLDTQVNGNDATVTVLLAIRRTEGRQESQESIGFQMRRDHVYVLGMIPTMRWRIVSANNLPSEMSVLGE